MASVEQLEAVDRLLSSGAWHQAEAAAQATLADDPADPQARRLLGLAVAAMGENERAAPILNQAAAQAAQSEQAQSEQTQPEHPCADLARLRPSLPRTLVARQFRACLLLAPNDDALRLGFASFLLDNGQPGEAERILQDGPDSAACHHLRGLARAELNQFVAAAESFRRAVTLNPDAAPSWSNLGMVLKIEGRFDEAIEAHNRAVVIGGGDPRHRVNRAVALLKAGRWTEAWADYEARLDLTDVPLVEPGRLMPSLSPGDRLTGMTILAMHEDGFGDTLQFLRYIPLLAARGARVLALVPRPLARLMGAVPGVAAVVTDRRRLPAHDLVCPMFSLPRVFGTTVGSIPPVPEVAIDPDLLRHWAGRLPIGDLRVGLVWAGQARPSLPGFGTLDRRRSAGLAAFQPVLDVPGVSFVSLQAGPAARQTRPPGAEIFDPMPEVTDFADTAAIVAALDLVISVDTSVVHLAGLLGKPVFLLDRYDGCWRWLSGRRDSPWYPGLTIFRQDQPGDWPGAMARAAASLEAMAIFRGLGASPGGMRECAFVA